MHRLDLESLWTLALSAILLGACTPLKPVVQPDQPQPQQDQRAVVEPPPVAKIDPMADAPGDKPLPALSGATERIDCINGEEGYRRESPLRRVAGR